VEEIKVTEASKEAVYAELIPQIISLVKDEPNPIANMANIVAALKQSFSQYSWVGFYLFDTAAGELVLGPFQGKIACTRIAVGKGVCGTSFQKRETIIVADVNQFPGHIFCDGDSRSEIVVPIIHHGAVIGVLDVDSHEFNSFDQTDKEQLEYLISIITGKIIFT
jgi:L-methionine (R)-S-oxide reductase